MAFVRNSFVTWLLSRSFGQGGNVSVPQPTGLQDDILVSFPGAVQDVLNTLLEQFAAWQPSCDVIDWCFLVGGPGNGKSEASRQLAGALRIDLPTKSAGAPAPRTVPDDWPDATSPVVPGLEIVFVNDASIPRQEALDSDSGSLFLDIRDALSINLGASHALALFANVNRGILVEEQSRLDKHQLSLPEEQLAAEIIRWLSNPPSDSSQDFSQLDLRTVVAVDPKKPYYGQLTILGTNFGARFDIRCHVVFLDVLSLLEPSPGINHAIDFNTNPPSLSPYHPIGNLSDNNASRNSTIAGELVSTIVDGERWNQIGCLDEVNSLCAAYEYCPLAQNAKWLRNHALRQNYLDMLRASEVAASRRYTFRDLLGQLSLSILGSIEPEWSKNGNHPCDWVAERVRRINSKTSLVELISHRIYMNVFPMVGFDVWKKHKNIQRQGDFIYNALLKQVLSPSKTSSVPAFERAFALVDPAKDVEPWGQELLRIRVLDVIEALDVEAPSEAILEWLQLPSDTHSVLEVNVDVALRDEVIDELTGTMTGNAKAPQIRNQFLRKWRCISLLRQVGLATGNFAFKPALVAWLSQQASALESGTLLELGNGLRSLMFQSRSSDHLMLAPLRPRTYALSNDIPPNTILVQVSIADLRLDVVSEGDNLIAEIQVLKRNGFGKKIASIVVDLAIAREAILHSVDAAGDFTEIGSSAFARIERARAALIGREQMHTDQVHYSDDVGNIYRLSNNPVGAVPLRANRVQR
jgi:hypothetical protein